MIYAKYNKLKILAIIGLLYRQNLRIADNVFVTENSGLTSVFRKMIKIINSVKLLLHLHYVSWSI